MVDARDWANPWGLAARVVADGARASGEVQQRLLDAMRLVGDEVGGGGGRGGGGGSDPVARYWRGVATATTTYYRELARAMAHHVEPDGRRDHPGPWDDDGDGAARDRRARIRLDGVVGATVAATFTVENSDPDPAQVSLVTGPCRSGDGEPFAAPATVRPATATIAPGDAIAVTVRIELDPDVFTPGRTYVLPVRVDGPRPTGVDLAITVDSAELDDEGPPYRVACPTCLRTFERTTTSLRLRPHKTPDGDDCPERDGQRVP